MSFNQKLTPNDMNSHYFCRQHSFKCQWFSDICLLMVQIMLLISVNRKDLYAHLFPAELCNINMIVAAVSFTAYRLQVEIVPQDLLFCRRVLQWRQFLFQGVILCLIR